MVRKTSDTKCLEERHVELIYGDITDKESVEEAVRDVNLIFHLAAEVYPKRSKSYFDTNVNGTHYLMNACIDKNINKVVYFSSTAVFGPAKNINLKLDETCICKPISPYGKSKLEAERILFQHYKEYGVPIAVLRPPVVYGPELYEFSLVSLILKAILKKRFFMVGNGNNCISLCYIDNLIHAAMLAATMKEADGEIFIIADEESLTFKEIIDSIYGVIGMKEDYVTVPIWIAKSAAFFLFLLTVVVDYPIHISPNTINEFTGEWGTSVYKANKILNYKPVVNFYEGIERTVKNIRKV